MSKALISLFGFIITKDNSKARMRRNCLGLLTRPSIKATKFCSYPTVYNVRSWFSIRIWIQFRKCSQKSYFCKTANKKEWSAESKAFSKPNVARDHFLFKIVAVSSTSCISFPFSVIYLFFAISCLVRWNKSGNVFQSRF